MVYVLSSLYCASVKLFAKDKESLICFKELFMVSSSPFIPVILFSWAVTAALAAFSSLTLAVYSGVFLRSPSIITFTTPSIVSRSVFKSAKSDFAVTNSLFLSLYCVNKLAYCGCFAVIAASHALIASIKS